LDHQDSTTDRGDNRPRSRAGCWDGRLIHRPPRPGKPDGEELPECAAVGRCVRSAHHFRPRDHVPYRVEGSRRRIAIGKSWCQWNIGRQRLGAPAGSRAANHHAPRTILDHGSMACPVEEPDAEVVLAGSRRSRERARPAPVGGLTQLIRKGARACSWPGRQVHLYSAGVAEGGDGPPRCRARSQRCRMYEGRHDERCNRAHRHGGD